MLSRIMALASNMIFRIAFPTLFVGGFFYTLQQLIGRWIRERVHNPKRISLASIVIGAYFLGHPFYPVLVPLIKASTPWLFAIGGVYTVLGAAAFGLTHRRHSVLTAWFVCVLSVVVAVLAAGGLKLRIINQIFSGGSISPPLLLSLPLSAMFAFGYESQLQAQAQPGRSAMVVYGLYALILSNSIDITETIRGPAAVVFIAFGCIGIILGLPLYGLGSSLVRERV